MPSGAQGATVEVAAPSVADDPDVRAFFGRHGARRARARACCAELPRLHRDRRHRRPARRSASRRWCSIAATTGSSTCAPGGGWPSGFPARSSSSSPGGDHNFWYDGVDLVVGEVEEFLLGGRRDPSPTGCCDRAVHRRRRLDRAGGGGRRRHAGATRSPPTTRSVRSALARHRGHEVKNTGDGFLATFDGPARAIRCAQAIVAAAAEDGLAVRAGVHTGEVELLGDDIGGIAVHVGSRVAALAAARGGADLLDGEGPRRRVADRVRRPRRARAQGPAGSPAALRRRQLSDCSDLVDAQVARAASSHVHAGGAGAGRCAVAPAAISPRGRRASTNVARSAEHLAQRRGRRRRRRACRTPAPRRSAGRSPRRRRERRARGRRCRWRRARRRRRAPVTVTSGSSRAQARVGPTRTSGSSRGVSASAATRLRGSGCSSPPTHTR